MVVYSSQVRCRWQIADTMLIYIGTVHPKVWTVSAMGWGCFELRVYLGSKQFEDHGLAKKNEANFPLASPWCTSCFLLKLTRYSKHFRSLCWMFRTPGVQCLCKSTSYRLLPSAPYLRSKKHIWTWTIYFSGGHKSDSLDSPENFNSALETWCGLENIQIEWFLLVGMSSV